MASTTLAMFGPTGVGKSSTGNTILGKDVFGTSSNAESETLEMSEHVECVKKRKIRICDIPGLKDTRMDAEDGVRLVVEAYNNFFTKHPDGVNAFLLPLKYGDRFGEETREAISTFEQAFGPDVLSKRGIICLTRGDDFEFDKNKKKHSHQSIQEWGKAQPGVFKEQLFEKCKGRVVLFENNTTDSSKKDKQIQALLSEVDKLTGKYTAVEFNKHNEGRLKLIVESKKPNLQTSLDEKLKVIDDKLDQVENERCFAKQMKALDDLNKECIDLLKMLETEDKKTGVLDDLVNQVKSRKNNVNEKRKSLQGEKDLKESRDAERRAQKRSDELQEQLRQDEKGQQFIDKAVKAVDVGLQIASVVSSAYSNYKTNGAIQSAIQAAQATKPSSRGTPKKNIKN